MGLGLRVLGLGVLDLGFRGSDREFGLQGYKAQATKPENPSPPYPNRAAPTGAIARLGSGRKGAAAFEKLRSIPIDLLALPRIPGLRVLRV